MEINTTWWRINASFQMATSTLSFLASTAMAVSVARSKASHKSFLLPIRRRREPPQSQHQEDVHGGNVCDNSNRPIVADHISWATRIRNESALRSSPYHRIIFGLSISDIFQSSSLLFGPLAVPKSVPHALFAVGNVSTCQISGLAFSVGAISTQMYTLLLSYYCLCKVTRRNMSDNAFNLKVERKVHVFILVYNLTICAGAVAYKTLVHRIKGTFCALGSNPPGCFLNSELYGECDKSNETAAAILIVSAYIVPTGFCLAGITICMARICCHIRKTTISNRGSICSVEIRTNVTDNGNVESLRRPTHSSGVFGKQRENLPHDNKISTNNTKVGLHEEGEGDQNRQELAGPEAESITPYSSENRENSQDSVKLLQTQFKIQAFLYVAVYFVTYIVLWWVPFILRMNVMVIDKSSVATFLNAVFFPLGGMFNILVYTRPKVIILRNKVSGLSWIRAVFLVMKAGGVVPIAMIGGRNDRREIIGHHNNRRGRVEGGGDAKMIISPCEEIPSKDGSSSVDASSLNMHLYFSSRSSPALSLADVLAHDDISEEEYHATQAISDRREETSTNNRKQQCHRVSKKDVNLLDSPSLSLFKDWVSSSNNDPQASLHEAEGLPQHRPSAQLGLWRLYTISEDEVFVDEDEF